MSKIREMRRAIRAAAARPVAYQICDGFGAGTLAVLETLVRSGRVSDAELLDTLAGDTEADDLTERARRMAAPIVIPAGKGGKATALVSVRGVALYDVEFQPYAFSTLLLSQTVAALANDPEIGTVVLDMDTPGGDVVGTKEAADAVFAARDKVRVVALINPLAASAGYWIASQASEIVAVPSADVGSIGVYMLHCDMSGMLEMDGVKPTFIFAKNSPHKVEGNPFEALGEETRAHWQDEVDTIMGEFTKAVARGRGVPVAKVLADFGQGRTLMAPAAKTAGMVDRVATLSAALARWGVNAATLEGRRRGEAVDAEASAPPAGGAPDDATVAVDEGGATPPPAVDAESAAEDRRRASDKRRRRLALERMI
jgi:signal peptide peptidase SppA